MKKVFPEIKKPVSEWGGFKTPTVALFERWDVHRATTASVFLLNIRGAYYLRSWLAIDLVPAGVDTIDVVSSVALQSHLRRTTIVIAQVRRADRATHVVRDQSRSSKLLHQVNRGREIIVLSQTSAGTVLRPLMDPEGVVVGVRLLILSIRPVRRHIIPPNFIGDSSIESFSGAIMRISTSRILRPQSVDGEVFVPEIFGIAATVVIGLAAAESWLPRLSKHKNITRSRGSAGNSAFLKYFKSSSN